MKTFLLSWLQVFISIFLMQITVLSFAQTNPTTGSLPYNFSGASSIPNTMAIHRFGTSAGSIPTTRITTDGNADLPSTTTNNSGGYMIEGTSGAEGISLLASGSQAAGAIVVEISTIGKQTINVSWVAWTKLNQSSYDNSIALQYRVGETGAWINVDSPNSSVYTTSANIGRTNGVTFNNSLPADANDKSIVQLRWVYWVSSGTTGSRDRLAIDDISIDGSSACTPPSNPNGIISGTTPACSSTTLTYTSGSGQPESGVSYYWQTSISGTNTTDSADNPLSVSTSGTYYVRAYNGACWSNGASSSFTVAINQSQVISNQPTNQSTAQGNSATFSITASSAISYQWQLNDGNGWSNISGANTSSYNTGATTASMNGYQYRVIVVGASPCVDVTSNAATLTVILPQIVDWANFQGLSSSTIVETGSTDAYARVYEPGLTPGAGAGTGINAWIGYSTTNAATEADFANASWTWVSAGYFGESGNNDEYKATLSGLVPGTYYIVSRFQLGGAGSTEPYKYGGNGNNFWSSPSSSTVLTVNSDIVDWANIQYPLNATSIQGSDITIYARVYEPGITNSVGQGSGINAWIGYSTSNNNPNSISGWTWLPATFHGDANGLNSNDNDEYKVDLGASLSPGIYYYASRFQKNGSPSYVYGGTGGIWNNDNGTLTISALDAPVATAATNIASNSFTANWNSVTDADSYVIDWSTNPNFISQNYSTIVGWNFPNNPDDATADIANTNNSSKTISLIGNTGTINFTPISLSSPAVGSTTSTANQSNGWVSGNGTKYWQVNFSTIGYENIRFSSQQRSSNTGPKDFKVQYKIGSSGIWNDVTGATVSVINDFTTVNNTGILSNIVLPALCNNQSDVYLRWIMTSNTAVNGSVVASTGSSAIDNINIEGNAYDYSTISAGAGLSYNLTNLQPVTTYYYRVRAINGSTISGNSNVISATTQMAETVWAGSPAAWSNGTPNSTTNAIINADYNDVSFTANNITINNGRTLTIGNGNSVSVSNVINNGNIIVNDGGNFIQSTGSSYTTGAGSTFVVNKNTSSASGKYVFWSAPVQGQNIFDIYGTAGTPQYVMTYNSNTDLYPTVSNPTTAGQGIGYSVKVPSASAQAIFSGIPNNGDIPVTLDATANTNGNTWNLIGNPYPSNLNLVSLYNGGNNGIASSIYLWDNLSATNTSQQQAATTWAIFNASGSGTWSQTGSLSVSGVSVKPGQGFIVKATSGTTTFTNSMRNGDVSSTFVNKNVQNLNEGKYWLTLTTPSGSHYTTAVTYGEGAQNTYDAFDSAMMSVGADAVYSYLNPNKLAIQGRDYFVNTDVVPLGNKQSTSGTYTISLTNKTGVFAGGQDIYLRDKLLNIYTNLQTNTYTYSGVVSEQQDRFEIVYQTQGSLGTSENVKEQIQVYKEGDSITISSMEKIQSVEVYDSAGRLVKTLFPKLTKTSLQLDVKGVYLLKIKSGSYTLTKKVIL